MRVHRDILKVAALCAATLSNAAADIVDTPAPATTSSTESLYLEVDARRIHDAILRVRLLVPIGASPVEQIVRLAYPQWIPGRHTAAGNINDVVDLKFRCVGDERLLRWTRDATDMYRFDVLATPGCGRIEVAFDVRAAADEHEFFGLAGSATPMTGQVDWYTVVLSPAGKSVRDIMIVPTVRFPPGWEYASALPAARADADTVWFEATTLETLVDSPLMMGRYHRVFDLTPSPAARRHLLSLFSDAEPDTQPEISGEHIEKLRQLVRQANVLFGTAPYEAYRFLVMEQRDSIISGLEHRSSSDNRISTGALASAELFPQVGVLLAHEFVHAWNGNLMRPEGARPDDFNTPIDGRLLWVYEGLTAYWGEVLATRAGVQTAEQFRQRLAITQAAIDHTAGRAWRPLQDTATSVQLMFNAPDEWTSLRRSDDFYVEGLILWLEADVLLREQTRGRKSLDDFARTFFLHALDSQANRKYGIDRVVEAMNAIHPYDWRAFFRTRLDALTSSDRTRGTQLSGWQVAYGAEIGAVMAALGALEQVDDQRHGLGLLVTDLGHIQDVIPGSAADLAGIVPGWTLQRIDDRAFNPNLLREVIKARSGEARPFTVVASRKGSTRTFAIDYGGGLRYPYLQRRPGALDHLSAILEPQRD